VARFPLTTLNTYRLRILQEVAARGTLTAAADALFLTSPAVSHQMATLEREVGVALFERTPRSLKLTAAGEKLVRHAETILADCEVALADVQSFSNEVAGVVRMSILETTANPGAMLLRERVRHPGLKLTLISMHPGDALSALRARDIDIALGDDWDCLPAIPSKDTTRFDLLSEGYQVVLPIGHPLANETSLRLSDLTREQWCVAQERGFRKALQQTMRTAGFTPNVVLWSFNSRALVLSAEIGLGIGVIPTSADTRGATVALVPLAEPDLTRRVFALVRSGSQDARPIRAVLEALKETAVWADAGSAPWVTQPPDAPEIGVSQGEQPRIPFPMPVAPEPRASS
jgi:DNA-binding transcriptional LysR family regulator